MKSVVVSLSGGMDSSTLLLRALSEYDNVVAVSFDYGQKHRWELQQARSLVDYLKSKGKNVTYEVIELKGLVSLLNSSLIAGGEDVPEGHYEQASMKKTVVPNRNKIFSSITQAVALSIANQSQEQTDIALGIHAGDHAIYPDCRQEFRDADDQAFRVGNWDSERVGFFTPYLQFDKLGILKDGQVLCKKLGLEFNEVYSRTNTSYKPIQHEGVWYSDYKSSSSIERLEAFIKLGRPDPVKYADETGPVEYEVARKHAERVLRDYQS